jgi:hypothetical protein
MAIAIFSRSGCRLGRKLSEFGGGMAAEADVARVQVADDFILQDNFRHYVRPADQELGKTFRAEA